MKLQLCPVRRQRGITLVVSVIIAACSLLILASTLSWTSTNVTLSARNNEYFRTMAVAEAATEKVVAAIESDYQAGGDTTVQANLGTYRGYAPLYTENALFAQYDFNDANAAQTPNGKTFLQFLPPTEFRVLTAQYQDLYGYSSIYRVISNAREKQSRYKIAAAVWQDVETATIPLFQFAIFYTLDLEINPGANMTVTGPVHGNSKLYLDPGAALTFQSHVTASSDIIKQQKPGDPNTNRNGTLTFGGPQQPSSGVSTLNVPIGVDNSVTNVRQVVEPPPFGEDATSAMGKQRFYNKADIIVTVTDTTNTVTSGIVNNKGTLLHTNLFSTIPSNQRWLNTSRTLYNKRENGKTVKLVEIDVAKLVTWNTSVNNTLPLRPVTGGTKDVTIIYVDDQRTIAAGSEESGVVVRNGELLPPYGLTVATPEPLYVHGNYNVKTNAASSALLGSANTARTLPAALIGDAITVLSSNWVMTNASWGASNFNTRAACDTTVNAAFLAGIVETSVANGYSGGAENFPRFLENWGGDTFTYNGSMVVMYPSKYATGLWINTGSTVGIYDPPTRNWAFDLNFRDPAKLPPGTPCVRVLIRGAWAAIKPGTTNITDPDALIP